MYLYIILFFFAPASTTLGNIFLSIKMSKLVEQVWKLHSCEKYYRDFVVG